MKLPSFLLLTGSASNPDRSNQQPSALIPVAEIGRPLAEIEYLDQEI